MLEFWYHALASPHGIKVSTIDMAAAKRQLYAARSQARDQSLDGIALVPSRSDPTILFLVRKDATSGS